MDGMGKRVKELRRALGLTQVELAKKSGVAQSTISDIERADTTYVIGPTLAALSDALGTHPSYLTKGKSPGDDPERMDESKLVALFRSMPDADREALLRVAESMARTNSK